MKITFYPYDFEYKVENGKVYVYSYSKLNNGRKVAIKHQHRVFFYASLDNVNQTELKKRLENLTVEKKPLPAKVIGYEEVERELLGKNKSFLKIYANYPQAVPLLAKQLDDWGVECFEKDILFIHRYLRDLDLIPMTEIEAEGEYQGDIFLAETLKQKSKNTCGWKILALDIETYSVKKEIDMVQNPILMIALYGKEFRKVITWKKFSASDASIDFVEDEKKLLEKVSELIKKYSPEIITGYFSDGFDLPYIKKRVEITKAKFDFELVIRDQARSGEVKINKLLHLDLIKFIKQIFGLDLKVESYSLDNIAEKLLGSKKHIVNLDKLTDVWNNHPEKLEEFCSYNLQDAKLTFELCEKLLADMIEFSVIIGLPLFDITRMRFGRLVESYILKKAIAKNVIAPNRPGDSEVSERMNESIKGAFVYEPTPGLYRDLAVFDFRSLYPTIIISHNIGPEGFHCSCCQDNQVPFHSQFWFCSKKQSFLPSVLKEVIDRRTEVKKQIKLAEQKEKVRLEAKSYALKILANSFYGYLGYYGARWYTLESAASTTAYARYYIRDTITKAEKKGFKVCYADTDSCFLLLGDKQLDEAMTFMRDINGSLPGNMELEFEGFFTRGIFVAIKGSGKSKLLGVPGNSEFSAGTDKGAKKKYALLSSEGKIKITGFETVRRNWSVLAKEVQREVLRLVLEDKVDLAIAYTKSVVKDLKKGNMPLGKLILKTQLTRPLKNYRVLAPHILVAQKMVEQGEPVSSGTLIKYIIVKGSGLIRDRAKLPHEVKEGEYDCDYYINHQLIPAVSSILTVFNYSEEDLFQESSQTGLGKFI